MVQFFTRVAFASEIKLPVANVHDRYLGHVPGEGRNEVTNNDACEDDGDNDDHRDELVLRRASQTSGLRG
jgi:hypothetical protein